MKRAVIPFASIVCAMLPTVGLPVDVESFYHESIAGRKTGVYEQDGTVYFHTSSVLVPGTDDHAQRRAALLAVRKLMFDWMAGHSASYEALPEKVRRIDSLCEEFGGGASSNSVELRVSGRGFSDESDGKYAYCLAVPLDQLLREAKKGVPGKTERDIMTRWKEVCARELSREDGRAFLAKVGCGDLNVVPRAFADKLSAECAFLDGWEASSPIVAMLKTTERIDKKPEDLWMGGLELISDLKDGKLRLADSGSRLHAALLETPGSPILWCYLGEYLKGRRLYRLSAVAYKNAFCLSGNVSVLALLKSSSGNLAHIYRMLHCDAEADGFEMISMGVAE